MSLIPFPSVMMMQSGGLNPFVIGNDIPPTPGNGQNATADFAVGAAYLATENGVVNFMNIRGADNGVANTCDYRMCIYAAISQTVWGGALLGQTAIQNSLNDSEVKKVALLAPVNIIAGNWYALIIQTDSPGMSTAESTSYGDRFFAATFNPVPPATAGASSLNSNEGRCIWASTV